MQIIKIAPQRIPGDISQSQKASLKLTEDKFPLEILFF